MEKKVSVLGGGSFGTAIATLLAKKGEVALWCFEEEAANDIISSHINDRYLSGIVLSKNIKPTTSLYEAVKTSSIIFVAVPMRYFRSTLEALSPEDIISKQWVITTKGIEQKTSALPHQILEEIAGQPLDVSILSGPTFARELAHHQHSAAVLATKTHEQKNDIAPLLLTNYFTLNYSSDLIGVQLCGALKNVLAMLIGIAKGEQCNLNVIAFLFSEGINEIATLIEAFGGKKETAYHLAGIGDAVLTAFGELGRNQKAGILFGQGSTLSEVINSLGHEPEGINTVRALHEIITQKNLNLPVLQSTHDIIFEQHSIHVVIEKLFRN